jgi:hypothetical protein
MGTNKHELKAEVTVQIGSSIHFNQGAIRAKHTARTRSLRVSLKREDSAQRKTFVSISVHSWLTLLQNQALPLELPVFEVQNHSNSQVCDS